MTVSANRIQTILASLLAISLFAVAIDAEAGRRSLRIEFEDFGWSQALPLGSVDCPGSAAGSPSVFWRGIQFSGGSSFATYNVDEYCQHGIEYDADNPDAPYLNESLIFDADDDGIKQKIGSNNDSDPINNVTARVYSFMDRDRFEDGVQGFQWEFFFFPGDQTLVRLNGSLPIPGGADFDPFIDDGSLIWEGSSYDGEFWCFNGSSFVGTWDGAPAGASPLAGCGPDAGCYEFYALSSGGGGGDPAISPSQSPGCDPGLYNEGQVIEMTARPDPGYKVSGWYQTDDDASVALVNRVTKDANPDQQFAEVYYEPAIYCPEGTEKQMWLDDDMESGVGGWTHSAAIGADTWALESGDSVSPTHAWHGLASNAPSDIRLVSPTVDIPAMATNAVLGFYNQRRFRLEVGGSACTQGAVIEYSVDGGANWLPFEYDDFLADPYDGLISAFQNPLDAREAWCGAQRWIRTEVDLINHTGKTMNFRLRIGTDDAGDADGWQIDDFQVAGCVLPELIYTDGFELP